MKKFVVVCSSNLGIQNSSWVITWAYKASNVQEKHFRLPRLGTGLPGESRVSNQIDLERLNRAGPIELVRLIKKFIELRS